MEKAILVFEEVARLADAELIVGLRRWMRADRALTARLLVHLAEVDARGLYRERAWPSMFVYAVEELHMSESEAYVRIAAARLGRKFPRVVELLAQGALHLTAIKLLGPHLTPDNHVDVLERACGKSTSEIERFVTELAPKPDVPSRIRKLPTPVSTGASPASTGELSKSLELEAAVASSVAARPIESVTTTEYVGAAQLGLTAAAPTMSPLAAAISAVATQPEPTAAVSRRELGHDVHFQLEPAPRNASSTTPLRPGRYKVEFTVGEAMHCKLEQLKALLRHQVPDGDLATILERAADLLLEKTKKQRFAQTTRSCQSKSRASEVNESLEHMGAARPRLASGNEAHATELNEDATHVGAAQSRKPRANEAHRVRPGHAHSRYIPRSVVREVHARDGEQCSFVSSDGRRCPERGFLELHHHDRPHARGGGATTANLRIVCRTHNALFAEWDYGRAFIHSKLLHARLRKRDQANGLVSRRASE